MHLSSSDREVLAENRQDNGYTAYMGRQKANHYAFMIETAGLTTLLLDMTPKMGKKAIGRLSFSHQCHSGRRVRHPGKKGESASV